MGVLQSAGLWHCFALPPRGYTFLTPGPTVGVVVGSLCASTGTQPNSTDSAASVRPACSVGVGLGNEVLPLPPEELPVCRERGKPLYLKRAMKCHQLCLHKDSAIVCSGGGSVGDRSQAGVCTGPAGPEVPEGRASSFPFFRGSHRPRARWVHKELQCLLLTEPFPFVSVSVSLSISVSTSLWFPLVSQHPFRAPRGAELGGPGSGNGAASCSHQGQ